MESQTLTPSYLQLEGIGKTFGSGSNAVQALGRVDLQVREGEFMAIVGPSGCGKSTLLQIAAGLASSSQGTVRLAGRPVSAPPPGLVYLFQQYAKSLFAWRTVIDKIGRAHV